MSIIDTDIEIRKKIDVTILQSVLTREARKRADKIARDVFSYYMLAHHRKPRLNEYPPVVAACAKDDRMCYIETTRHDVKREEIDESLLKILEDELGPYGAVLPPVERCAIGHCAEPQAANELLKYERVNDIKNDIYFGDAYRPRTGTVEPPCGNCQKTFNNVII